MKGISSLKYHHPENPDPIHIWVLTFSFITWIMKHCKLMFKCLHIYVPGRADRRDGGSSQGNAMQPALLQQRCVVIRVLSLGKNKRWKTHFRGSNLNLLWILSGEAQKNTNAAGPVVADSWSFIVNSLSHNWFGQVQILSQMTCWWIEVRKIWRNGLKIRIKNVETHSDHLHEHRNKFECRELSEELMDAQDRREWRKSSPLGILFYLGQWQRLKVEEEERCWTGEINEWMAGRWSGGQEGIGAFVVMDAPRMHI